MAILSLGNFGRIVTSSARLAFVVGCVVAIPSRLAPAASPKVEHWALPVARAERSRLETEASLLARRWAPSFVQETSADHAERDRPLPIDFDGDWDATNNWSHLTRRAARLQPAVYWSAILSETHAYLTYTLFYPRDWLAIACLPYLCHDNDLEVVLIVVERGADPARDPGRLVFAESKRHRHYVAVRGADLARNRRGQPLLAVESQGHGVLPLDESAAREVDGGVVLAASVAGGSANGYLLLPLHDTLWARRHPGAEQGRLWTESGKGSFAYRGARLGAMGMPVGAAMAGREYPGGVTPPWGLTASKHRGDWFFDPAFVALSRHASWFGDQPVSVTYLLNAYVEDLAGECRGSVCARRSPRGSSAPLSVGGALMALAAVLAVPRRRHRAGSGRASAPRIEP